MAILADNPRHSELMNHLGYIKTIHNAFFYVLHLPAFFYVLHLPEFFTCPKKNFFWLSKGVRISMHSICDHIRKNHPVGKKSLFIVIMSTEYTAIQI